MGIRAPRSNGSMGEVLRNASATILVAIGLGIATNATAQEVSGEIVYRVTNSHFDCLVASAAELESHSDALVYLDLSRCDASPIIELADLLTNSDPDLPPKTEESDTFLVLEEAQLLCIAGLKVARSSRFIDIAPERCAAAPNQ